MEREGVSLRYPFKPILIGTFCPDGGDFSDFFLDKARKAFLLTYWGWMIWLAGLLGLGWAGLDLVDWWINRAGPLVTPSNTPFPLLLSIRWAFTNTHTTNQSIN